MQSSRKQQQQQQQQQQRRRRRPPQQGARMCFAAVFNDGIAPPKKDPPAPVWFNESPNPLFCNRRLNNTADTTSMAAIPAKRGWQGPKEGRKLLEGQQGEVGRGQGAATAEQPLKQVSHKYVVNYRV